MSETLTIARVGAGGDGVAETGDGPVYVPFTLPGELAAVAQTGDRATVISLRSASPERIAPACRHFEDCGGCVLQHWHHDHYLQWKRELVVSALASRGLEAPVDACVAVPPGTRRRATFTAVRAERGVVVGFNTGSSHHVVDLRECPVLEPQLLAARPMLSALVRLIIPRDKTLRLTVTLTMTGLDVAVTGTGKLADKARIAASDFAMTHRLARLTIEGELVVEPGAPMVELSGIQVTLPAGGFLQATLATENAINAQVSAHLKKAKRVADLFAGCGTLTFALARKSAVHAVEMDKASVAALDKARRHATGLKAVSVEARDLFRRPLMAAELNDFDGVVFDPPRAGAEEQCGHLARSKVKRVVAVSCNPATLARDLRILVDGGYRIKSVTPIDQFLWSPHVEVVASLER